MFPADKPNYAPPRILETAGTIHERKSPLFHEKNFLYKNKSINKKRYTKA